MTRRCIGVLSDTHGLLRPEAVAALEGCDAIVHAGDIGGPRLTTEGLLSLLGRIAPVHAVRGNNDRDGVAATLPLQCDLDFDGVRLRVVHDLKTLAGDAAGDGIALVVSGHSHRPQLLERDGVRYLNPGSAGPRRFRLPVTLARLHIEHGQVEVEPVPLLADVSPAADV